MTDMYSVGGADEALAGRLHRCSRCHQWKPESDFHHSRSGEFTYCRECRNAYDRAYYANSGGPARRARRRRAVDEAREWMNALKADIPCADCGQVYPVFVMHWDHLPGFEKVAEVGKMLGRRARKSILNELQKCELVCANCHVMRTVERATGAHRTS